MYWIKVVFLPIGLVIGHTQLFICRQLHQALCNRITKQHFARLRDIRDRIRVTDY